MKRFLDWLLVRQQPRMAFIPPWTPPIGSNVIWGSESLKFPEIDPGLLSVDRFDNRVNFRSGPFPMPGSDTFFDMGEPLPTIDPSLLPTKETA